MQPGESANYDSNKKPRHQHTGSHDGMAGLSYSASFPPRKSAPIVRRNFSERPLNSNPVSNPPFAGPSNSTTPASRTPFSMRESSAHPTAAMPSANGQFNRESTIAVVEKLPRRSSHNSAANSPERGSEEFMNIQRSEPGPGPTRPESPQVFQGPTAPWQANAPSPPVVINQPQTPTLPKVNIVQQFTRPSRPSERPIPHFVAEKSPGALNTAHPISLQDFQNDSLETFSARVLSRRQNQPIAQVWVRLKFTQRWGDREVFFVSKDADDDTWQDVKSNIEDNFEYARDSMPELRTFRVWVNCEFEETKYAF